MKKLPLLVGILILLLALTGCTNKVEVYDAGIAAMQAGSHPDDAFYELNLGEEPVEFIKEYMKTHTEAELFNGIETLIIYCGYTPSSLETLTASRTILAGGRESHDWENEPACSCTAYTRFLSAALSYCDVEQISVSDLINENPDFAVVQDPNSDLLELFSGTATLYYKDIPVFSAVVHSDCIGTCTTRQMGGTCYEDFSKALIENKIYFFTVGEDTYIKLSDEASTVLMEHGNVFSMKAYRHTYDIICKISA